MSEIPAETLEQLKTKHGAVTTLTAGDESIAVLSVVPRASYKRFRARRGDPASGGDALEQLLFDVTVHPDRAGLNAILDRAPALADVFGAKVLELAGLREEADAKKQ